MSDLPIDWVSERINRLMTAMADLMASQAALGRNMAREFQAVNNRLDSLEGQVIVLTKEVRSVGSEQLLMANRIEESFQRCFQTNQRIDALEDRLQAR